jgi:integrase
MTSSNQAQSENEKKTPTVESKTRRLNSFYQPNKPEEARLTHFSEVTNSRPDAEAPQMHDQSEAKPRVKTDPPRDETITAVNRRATFQTRLDEPNHAILRNHGFDKGKITETAVSSIAPAELILPSRATRSLLRLVDPWNSEYASVQRMLDYLRLRKTGSLQSVRTICDNLSSFCKALSTDPDSLVSLPRDQIEARIQEHCNKVMERSRLRGRSANYANTVLASLKTFFARNRFKKEYSLELRVESYHQPPRTTNRPEYIPSLKEALLMTDRARTRRDRAIILTAITTGLRNSALRAIRVGDIRSEIEQKQEVVCVSIDSSWNDRIPGACKNCIPYYTFMHGIAAEAVRSMLKERETRFGSYAPAEPLFISNYNQLHPSRRRVKVLASRELQIIVQNAAQAADVSEWKNVHVHTLRKVLESVLRTPLVDGTAMDSKDQEFLMGHKLRGSQENYYDRSKKERMRELYSKLVFEDMSSIQSLALCATQKIAKLLGVKVEEVKTMKEKELGRSLSNQELESLLEQEIKLAYDHRDRESQRVIPLAELDEYVASGWSVVTELTDGRIVVKGRPAPTP